MRPFFASHRARACSLGFVFALAFLPSALADGPGRSPADALVDEENAPLVRWLNEKRASLRPWLSRRGTPEGPPDYIDFRLDVDPVPLVTRTSAEAERSHKTKMLFNAYFPKNEAGGYLGTFFEGGHPYILTPRGPYQWNSTKVSGMEDPKLFREAVEALMKRGMKNIRLAPNLHQVIPGNPASWDRYIDRLETIWRAGGTPTISVAFFPSLKHWEKKSASGEVDPAKSYLLHPDWPTDMGDLTETLMTRVWERASKIEKELGRPLQVAVNPINEPETLASFNRQFWHGAHAPWGHPETMRYYVPSIVQIGKANVEIRRAVEKTSGGRRILFVHNEAMTPDAYGNDRGGGKYAVSKFMLGDDVLLKADLDGYREKPLDKLRKYLTDRGTSGKLNEVEWTLREYVFGAWNETDSARETARAEIITSLRALRDLHVSFARETGKTMKTDCMLHLDYYYQSEFGSRRKIRELAKDLADRQGKNLKRVLGTRNEKEIYRMLREAGAEEKAIAGIGGNPKAYYEILTRSDYAVLKRLLGILRGNTLGFEPQHYARQIRAGIRRGFYPYFMEYVNALRMFIVGVGESGTPFHTFAPLLHDQVMMEYAAALKAGIYGTQYGFGPAVDTRGWAKSPLGHHYLDDHEVNPSGLLTIAEKRNPGKTGPRVLRSIEERSWVNAFVTPFMESVKKPETITQCSKLLRPDLIQ
jgi:hypothetical protein